MAFTEVPTYQAGHAPDEADWDTYIKANMNAGTWVALADSTLTDTSASITFSTIDQTFAHLRIVAYLRATVASSSTFVRLRFNADTGANYDHERILGTAASVSADEEFGQTSGVLGFCAGASAGANLFSAMTIMVPNYANVANNKAALASWAWKGGTSTTDMASGRTGAFWRDNDAVTDVSLFPGSGDWAAGSRATLYALA